MGLSDNQIKFFADYIQKELGIVYSPAVYFQLEQRIEKIAQFFGWANAEEVYRKALSQGITGDFKQYLLDIATNNETSFFRDPKVWNAFEKIILPGLQVSQPKSFSYRIWCTAASFGQEPYSIAMLVHEFLKKNPGHPRIEIIASDIADHALKRCKEGRYTQLEVQRGLGAQRLIQYFNNDGDGFWSLKPEIKNMVDFRKQNLLEPFLGLGTFNIISCRYVLIYQDGEKKKEIIKRLEKTLSPSGMLILGASESALGISGDLQQTIISEGVIGYKKADQ